MDTQIPLRKRENNLGVDRKEGGVGFRGVRRQLQKINEIEREGR